MRSAFRGPAHQLAVRMRINNCTVSRLSRPGAGYPRSEGSGAKFVVYLGRATAARALKAELEDIQTQLRHHSLRVSVEFLAAHWR